MTQAKGFLARVALVVGALAVTASIATGAAASAEHTPDQFVIGFQFSTEDDFVVEVSDPEVAQEFHSRVGDYSKLVYGHLVLEEADYNPNWSFHIDPDRIWTNDGGSFVCDATPTEVEENLDLVGTEHFLPYGDWCPWSSYVKAVA